MKTTHLKPTRIDFPEENLEAFHLDKASAAKLIQDLSESLAGTGEGHVVFRDGHRFFVFKVGTK